MMNSAGKHHIKAGVPFSLSTAALLAGFFSLIKSAEGDFLNASRLIILAMILDGMDGNIARWLRATSSFGAEFDTFVDMTCFGLAPAVLAYEAVFRRLGAWGVLLPSLIVIAGAARLARFRLVNPARGQEGYVGLPITVAAGWVSLLIFVQSSELVIGESGLSFTGGPLGAFVWGVTLVMLVLEISTVRYPKPTKDPAFFVPGAIMMALIFGWLPVAVAMALLLCLCGLVFVVLGPMLTPVIHAPEKGKAEELAVFESRGDQ